MNRETFIHLIYHSDQVSAAEKEALEEVVVQYPYFQLAHFLLAKAYNQDHAGQATNKVKKAAVYASDRGMLKKFLSTKNFAQEYISLPKAVSAEEKNKPANSFSDNTAAVNESTLEPPVLPIIDYQLAGTPNEETQELPLFSTFSQEEESAQADSRKIKKIKQNEIIENFIKAEPRITAAQAKAKGSEDASEDLSEKGMETSNGFISENLAIIMVKQGKTDKAIDIYEKLILKYPQKNAYFATKIEELKKL